MKRTAALDLDANRQLLNRYRFVSNETMRIFAGWLPKAECFELKCELGRTIWESSLHVNALYLRLREIQSPAFQKPADPALVSLMNEMMHAPNEYALLLAYFRVLTPSLVEALDSHEKATFPNSDQPSVHAIQHMLLDLRAQLDRVQPLIRQAEQTGMIGPEALIWEQYIQELLAAAGGVSGLNERRDASPGAPPCRLEFATAIEAGRDGRFVNRGFDVYRLPTEENYEQHTLGEFTRYTVEILASETIAQVMYSESVKGMPWEFQFDTARHLYDEVRHALMGYEWMRQHGLDPFQAPQYLPVFRWRSQFPPVMQYCFITMGNEVHAFPYRHRRIKAHQRSGDKLSEQFVRYDVADETQHVRFGRRWLPKLLRHIGEKRSLKQYTEDTIKIWKSQYLTGQLPIIVE